jgi:hypothetical protein
MAGQQLFKVVGVGGVGGGVTLGFAPARLAPQLCDANELVCQYAESGAKVIKVLAPRDEAAVVSCPVPNFLRAVECPLTVSTDG